MKLLCQTNFKIVPCFTGPFLTKKCILKKIKLDNVFHMGNTIINYYEFTINFMLSFQEEAQ